MSSPLISLRIARLTDLNATVSSFTWILGIRTHIFMLAQQTLPTYLSLQHFIGSIIVEIGRKIDT